MSIEGDDKAIVAPGRTGSRAAIARPVGARASAQDWPSVERSLDEFGSAVLPSLLDAGQCERLAAGYADASL